MFGLRTFPLWIAVLSLSCVFLFGQESWPPPCADLDGDGYGNPASSACTHPGLDCDDGDPDTHPGISEAFLGDPACTDGIDNDCDGSVDTEDPGCWECTGHADCDDGNPCTVGYCLIDGVCLTQSIDGGPCDDGDPCTMNDICSEGGCSGTPLDGDGDSYVSGDCGGDDCDDDRPDVNPGMEEICQNGIDDDCNGLSDEEDPACSGCSSPAECNDFNVCTDDVCEDYACENIPLTGTPCDDGDPCTINDGCGGGACVPGQPYCELNQMCIVVMGMPSCIDIAVR